MQTSGTSVITMNITIKRATNEDLSAIMSIVKQAQAFMKTLNIDQWQNGYPNEEHFLEDIRQGQCHLFFGDDSLFGMMTLFFETEPCYKQISAPGWRSDGAYSVIHRMAVAANCRGMGVAGKMIDFAQEQTVAQGVFSLRTDTHRGNVPMQRLLMKNGFTYCGEVDYMDIGGDTIRLAYEKTLCPTRR